MVAQNLRFINFDNVTLYIYKNQDKPIWVKTNGSSPNMLFSTSDTIQFGSVRGTYTIDTSLLNSFAARSGNAATIYVYYQIPDDVRSDGTFTIYIQSGDGSVEYWSGAAGGGSQNNNTGEIIQPKALSSYILGKLTSWYDNYLGNKPDNNPVSVPDAPVDSPPASSAPAAGTNSGTGTSGSSGTSTKSVTVQNATSGSLFVWVIIILFIVIVIVLAVYFVTRHR